MEEVFFFCAMKYRSSPISFSANIVKPQKHKRPSVSAREIALFLPFVIEKYTFFVTGSLGNTRLKIK